MKKVNINTLEIVSPSLGDYMLVKTPAGIKYVDRKIGSRYMGPEAMTDIGVGIEHELIAFSGLFSILHANSGGMGVYISYASGIKLIDSTSNIFGDREDGTQGVLVYRKATNGPLFIKNNTGSIFAYRYYIY